MHPKKELMDVGYEYVDLPELYRRSDVISLHCPLTKESRYMINKDAIAQMKKGITIGLYAKAICLHFTSNLSMLMHL